MKQKLLFILVYVLFALITVIMIPFALVVIFVKELIDMLSMSHKEIGGTVLSYLAAIVILPFALIWFTVHGTYTAISTAWIKLFAGLAPYKNNVK